VERLETAVLPTIGSSDVIAVQMLALRLVAVEPIEVTYGGLDPELWDLEVALSSLGDQPVGEMVITLEYDNGGTYSSYLPVETRLVFTRQSDLVQAIMDPGPADIMETPPVPPWPAPAEACWSHSVPFPIVESEGNTLVDHDGNPATPRKVVPPSSNFVAGGCGFDAVGDRPGSAPMGPGAPPTDYQKVHSQETALFATHGVQPANPLVHFLTYQVDTIPVLEPCTLEDQFDEVGVPQPVTLLRIDYFSNPVDKNDEGLADPLSHLVWYRFVSLDPFLRWVDIQNQLFSHRLILLPAEYLLVPADKNDEGFPYMLDHYKAYRVLHGRYVNKFVHLRDQWIEEDYLIRKPVWFCTPVDKNDEGIINDVDHLVFYEALPSTQVDTFGTINDQFNTDLDLVADSTLWLGVPSVKLQWGVWFPTAAELCSYSATKYEGRIEVAWETTTETATGGFNIHRSLSEDGPDVRINDELIPAKGNELEGASYSFADRDVADGHEYYYWIESMDVTGVGTMVGPVFVAAAEETPIPAAFGLAQNHPNPFNPVTEIKYNLPVDCYVRLVVYDVLGRKVATLVDEHQTAGFKSAQWQVTSQVASGVYFYKLQAGSFVETKKMVLLR
jgi:hypothetical protein